MNSFITAIVAIALALPCLAFGSQVAILRNGFSIPHERHVVVGSNTRLYTSADGSYVDVPTSQIDHFEEDLTPAPAPAKTARQAASQITPKTATALPVNLPAKTLMNKTPMNLNLSGMVSEASGRHNIDPDLVNSVIWAESDFKVHAVSPKGAQGLMQLMPQTAATLGVDNVFDPRSNVEGGTLYLRQLLEKYNFDLAKALAAYNAGPLRVQQYGGVPPYYETRTYVARIIRDYNRKKLAEQKAAKLKKKAPVHSAKQPLLADSKQEGTEQPAVAHTSNKITRDNALR
ncbi:MAG TPA: lytic transglycosylase domain-containing protein [Terriglobales bacterium]